MAWTIASQIRALCIEREPFFDQINNHRNEARMNTNGCRSDKLNSLFGAQIGRFTIQVVKDFHMIGNEA